MATAPPLNRWALAAALAVALPCGSRADESIVLPPVQRNGSLPEKMLVLIPGGAVPNDKYVATARAIQQASPLIRLWVVIPAVFQRLCIISCAATPFCSPLHWAVEDVLKRAQDQGWKRGRDSDDLWLAGHSLGGVCANTLFQAYTSGSDFPFAGLIVMGSYVDESGRYDLTHYPKPVLILNAELDGGMARPGKTAVWWSQYLGVKAAKGEEYSVVQKPVIILPKLNHSDFCPGFNVPGDLMAEVSQEEATASIGEVAGAFLQAQAAATDSPGRAAAVGVLRAKVSWTGSLLKPYLTAQAMERTPSDTRISGEGSSPFCARAQHIVSGLSAVDDKRLQVLDGFHVMSSNLEHCHPNWTAAPGGVLSTRSCSHTDYYPDIDNTGSLTAASQIACKLLSNQRIARQMNATTSRVACREGNKYAVQVAESLAAPSTLERYRRRGRGWCFLDDEPVAGNVGPVWVFSSMLKLTPNATCMAVSSPSLYSEIDFPIHPGCHYCKFLSPARVLDWMMTDSLKPAAPAAAGKATELWV